MSSTSIISRVCGRFNQVTSGLPYIVFSVSFGLMVDMATYGMMVPVLPFRLEATGYKNIPATSSYLIAAFALGLIVSSIPIGIFGVMVKARKLPLLAALGFLVLIVARILQGFSGTAIWTLGLALICDVVKEERIGVIMGYVMIGWSIGTVGGPLAGGLLYDKLGYNAVFVFALIISTSNQLHYTLQSTRILLAPPFSTQAAIDFLLRSLVQDKKCIRNREVTLQEKAELNDKEASSTPVDSQSPSAARALLSLLTSPRVWTICIITFVLGFAFGGLLDTGLTMVVKERYGLSSRGAGLIFIAAVVPSFFSSPFAGFYADKYGAKWPIIVCLVLGTPFFGLLSMNGSLAALIAWITFTGMFTMATAAPIMQDLAIVVKITPGLGFAHVYGIFNMVYSTGAMVGPLCVGRLLQSTGIQNGWQIMSLIVTGLCAACIIPAYLFIGSKNTSQSSITPSNDKLDSPV
ncbi:hypothetical protein VP01_365g4 [Puccinia sorghi]|uniref:Major facilitator superfamily (MFS) profile domain-containing protein n=1 Tax=Puccinia sorghi TaxID=27349 RepID=A0A0L6UWD1_9BASI|nr:hypothetical protein VP01_365g4 [Puccinia sorghi]